MQDPFGMSEKFKLIGMGMRTLESARMANDKKKESCTLMKRAGGF